MRSILKTILIGLTTVLFLAQCKKDNTSYQSYFYTDKDNNETPLKLYIDDKYQGDLPYINPGLSYPNDSLKRKALLVTLKRDKYRLTAKDEQGNVRSEGTIKIKKNGLSSSGGIGAQEINSTGDCFIIRLSY